MNLANALKWTTFAVAVRYMIKLLGNLALARLLPPVAFGQMVIVLGVVNGIEAITDVGTKPALIRSARTDPDWLNTAWTMGILRGMFIAALIAITAVPAALFFRSPELAPLIAATASLSMFAAWRSISTIMAVRELAAQRLSILEVLEIAACYALMISWAMFSPTAWALVAGTVFSTGAYTLLSYHFFAPHSHRFRLDPSVVRHLFGFGKWVMLASVVGFVLLQWDRMAVGRLIGLEAAGVYSIAITWAASLQQLITMFVSRLYLPVVAKLRRKHGDASVAAGKLRKHILLAALVPFAWMAGASSPIIELLYPPTFIAAGPAMGILVVCSWFSLLEVLYNDQLMISGRPDRRLHAQLASIAVMAVLVLLLRERLSTVAIATIVLAGTIVRAIWLIFAYIRQRRSRVPGDVTVTACFAALSSLMWLLCQAIAARWGALSSVSITFALLLAPGALLAWISLRGILVSDADEGEAVETELSSSQLEAELSPW